MAIHCQLASLGGTVASTVEGWYAIAAYLGVADSTARKWERDGLLPCVRKNGASGRVWASEIHLSACKKTIEHGATIWDRRQPVAG